MRNKAILSFLIQNKRTRFIILGSVFYFISCQKKSEVYTKTNQSDSLKPYVNQKKGIEEKNLIQYLESSPLIQPNKDNGKPFSNLDYNKIIVYDFDGDEKTYNAPINKNGHFIPIIEKQRFLTQIQADKILKVLNNRKSYGEASAACFEPHFGLVFFKNNKKVNQISICLDCNGSSTEIEIPARTHRVFNKGTENEYSFTGFTPYGKNKIKELCTELDFYYKDWGKK